MCWLYVPGLEESNAGLDSLDKSAASLLARSVWWRRKSMQRRYWQKKWKQEAWMQRLFGPTLRHSQKSLTSFVEKWTSSLEATHASRSRQQDSGRELKTSDTFSRIYAKLSKQSSLPFVSSRTSEDTSALDSRRFTKAYEIWVSQLRRDYLARLRVQEARIKGNGCSSWPTAHENCTTGAGTQGREGGENLQTTAAAWATPTGRVHKDGNCKDANVPTNSLLGRQAPRTQLGQECSSDGPNLRRQWPTAQANDSTNTANRTANRSNPNSKHHDGITLVDAVREQGKKLNPNFVEWLMGFPLGWSQITASTDYERWEMRSYRVVQRWLSLI